MLNIDKLLSHHFPELDEKPLFRKALLQFLRKLLHEKEFVEFGKDYPDLRDMAFIEQVMEYFNFTYSVKHRERDNIPVSGRAVVVANHPLGSLDALSIMHALSSVRKDLKVVANDMLLQLKPIEDLLLPVDNMNGNTGKERYKAIEDHLDNEGMVLFFPAGEVSRMSKTGIRDDRWRTGFLRVASQTGSPILPVFSGGRNSWFFYGISSVMKPAATALLVQEMFNQRNKSINLTIGEQIPYAAYHDLNLSFKEKAHLFKRHTYMIGKGKKGTLRTQTGISLPENRSDLQRALNHCEALGETPDGKQIFLYRYEHDCAVMREIGRLREISFRAVGEGSGKKRDIDEYDRHYLHIVLWDKNDLEIVGAYRLLPTKEAIKNRGTDALYTASLFHFDDGMAPYLNEGLELGRSFIQPRYWGKRSLDYLWMGVGAFLARNLQYRYLFGPVSISNTMPDTAKALLIYFYKQYYSPKTKNASHKQPYELPSEALDELKRTFKGDDQKEDFRQLKSILSNMGTSVPTLYKQYSELCEPGGVQFLDFGIDPEFADCIDGLVLVDTHQLKPKKLARYLGIDPKDLEALK